MSSRQQGYASRVLTFVGLTLYAICLVVTPLEHHDIVCHLKTPLHCTACVSSHVGTDPQALQQPGTSTLAEAGQLQVEPPSAERRQVVRRPIGRSPPPSRI